MIRTIKLWWLMNRLQKVCLRNEGNCYTTQRVKVTVNQHSFITLEALRALRLARRIRASGKSPCSICDPEDEGFEKLIGKKYSKKLAKKIAFYRMLIRLGEKKKFIEGDCIKGEKDEQKCKSYGIRLSDEGNACTGLLDLVEMLLGQYKLTWAMILIPFGLWFIKEIIEIVAPYIS